MIFNFLDKLSGFLDRRFIVAYWAPVFLILGLLGAVRALHTGPGPLIRLWTSQDTSGKAVTAAIVLLGITFLAYVLQSLTSPVMRLFEGYTWLPFLAKWAAADQRGRYYELKAESRKEGRAGDRASYRLYFGFPPHDLEIEEYIRPTRLGNVLASAEHYARKAYGLSSEIWWPRLFPLLPQEFRDQISAALMPTIALLNLCCGCILVAFAGGAYLAYRDPRWWPCVVVFLGALALARLCYVSAVSQAVAYGNLIRSAFDLHRRAVLEKLGIFVPDTYEDERALWRVLNEWVYRFMEPSLRQGKPGVPAWVRKPFRYDGVVPSAPRAAEPAEYTVRLGWLEPGPSPAGDGG